MPVLPGQSEAAADALIARMAARLDLLNARLTLDDRTHVPTVLATQIYLGDADILPTSADCPVWFAVSGGEGGDGTEFAPEILSFGDSTPYINPYFATITGYVHPQFIFHRDPLTSEAIRHRALSRMSDWLRKDVFNIVDGLLIPLASREYGAFDDTIKSGLITRIRRAEAAKGPGGSIYVPCIRCDFEGKIA